MSSSLDDQPQSEFLHQELDELLIEFLASNSISNEGTFLLNLFIEFVVFQLSINTIKNISDEIIEAFLIRYDKKNDPSAGIISKYVKHIVKI